MSRTISERLARLKRLRASLAKDVAALDHEIATLDGLPPRRRQSSTEGRPGRS